MDFIYEVACWVFYYQIRFLRLVFFLEQPNKSQDMLFSFSFDIRNFIVCLPGFKVKMAVPKNFCKNKVKQRLLGGRFFCFFVFFCKKCLKQHNKGRKCY